MAKIQLVDNWRTAYRWYSVRIAAAISAAAGLWLAVPDEVKAAIPEKYKPLAVLVGGVAVAVSRVIRQSSGAQDGADEGSGPQ